jgi:endonuclease/exonuclease/phosphatase family metal-dependent hydrolase
LTLVSSANANTTLRVVSWNIQFGQGTDGVTSYDRIATWLARMSPDLIALCEVPPDKISTLVSLLTQKSGQTWYSHFVPKAPGIAEGNLILSRYSFSTVGSRYLSYQRSVAQVTVNVGGRKINFFATHLDHTSSSLRQTQAAEIIQWTGGFAAPRIVCGDLNAGNDTPEVLALLQAYRDAWVDALNQGAASSYEDNPPWMNTRTRRWRIDFILYAADVTALTARSANIPDTRDLSNTNVVTTLGTSDDKGVRPSDHNLVVSDFVVMTEAAPPPAPTLLTRSSTSRAVALHSVKFTNEPFLLRTQMNLSQDQRTRIMLFATNLDLLPGETPAAVTVRATDSRGNAYTLVVEQVAKIANLDWLTELTVILPDDTTISGDLSISASIHGLTSNSVAVGIESP